MMSFESIGRALIRYHELLREEPGKKYVIIKDGKRFAVVEKITCCLSRFWMGLRDSKGYYTREQADKTMIAAEIDDYVHRQRTRGLHYYEQCLIPREGTAFSRHDQLEHMQMAIWHLRDKSFEKLDAAETTVRDDKRNIQLSDVYKKEESQETFRHAMQRKYPKAYHALLRTVVAGECTLDEAIDAISEEEIDEILRNAEPHVQVVVPNSDTFFQTYFNDSKSGVKNLPSEPWSSRISTLGWVLLCIPAFLGLVAVGVQYLYVMKKREKILQKINDQIQHDVNGQITYYANNDLVPANLNNLFQRVLIAFDNDWSQAARFMDLLHQGALLACRKGHNDLSLLVDRDSVNSIRFNLSEKRIEVNFTQRRIDPQTHATLGKVQIAGYISLDPQEVRIYRRELPNVK